MTTDAITGGAFAQATEPQAVTTSTAGRAHGHCLNCGTTLIKRRCRY